MKILLVYLYSLAIFLLGAMAHENDITRECKNKGKAENTAWINEINCTEMKEAK